MNKFLASVALTALAMSFTPAITLAHVNQGMAPADEYFGQYHESILEIGNRLTRLEGRSDDDMLGGGEQAEMDNISAAVLDWQRQYPNDPWLPRTFARVMRCYRRAGATSTDGAVRMRVAMERAFPAFARNGGDWARFADSRGNP